MELPQLQLLIGLGSSLIFVVSNLPMLTRAFRTRNLTSYSLPHLLLANIGNAMHWLYVISLPFGPIWLLHSFNTFVAVTMIALYLHCERGWFRAQAPPSQSLSAEAVR